MRRKPADWKDHLGALASFWSEQGSDSDEVIVSKLAVKLRLGLNAVVESELQAAADKQTFWSHLEKAVSVAFGDNHVFTQHGVQKRLIKTFDPDAQRELIATVVATMDEIEQIFDVDYFLTSGTLLGIVRDQALIAHDDDVDVAYVSKAKDHFNWGLERRAILKHLRSRPGLGAKDHLPGLIHAEIRLPEGRKAQFDIFSAMLEGNRFVEYPLNADLLEARDVLPTSTRTFLGTKVRIPADPERFLWANYGEGWKVPDPTFRFNWALSGIQYAQRLCAMSDALPSIDWLRAEIGVVCGPPAPKTSSANFDSYKIAALEAAIELAGGRPRVLVLGASSAALIDHCLESAGADRIELRVADPLSPIDEEVGPYPVGKLLVAPATVKKLIDHKVGMTGDLGVALAGLDMNGYEVIYLDLPTYSSALSGLEAASSFLARKVIVVCDDFLYFYEGKFHSSQYRALLKWADGQYVRRVKCLGRTNWSQCIFNAELLG